ncbi:SusC/RagA family TonB-linked outer membrane protein [Mariniflexile sp. HMF6888]|uniref:SusC/RagA family TonB-linked outer membrane protein n=1 Tax=Mariniflexile sp. HMF6888 TaxID=3373086 RepID=UPI003792BB87
MKKIYLAALICFVVNSDLLGMSDISMRECLAIDTVQGFLVKGNISDEKGVPLAGATVIEAGTTNGVSTDFEGNFEITVKNTTAILVVSYLGYKTQNFSVDSEFLEIKLLPDSALLDEVVVTALGISRKSKSLTYATQKVEAKELTEVRDPNNIVNSFQGKVANVVITQSSGGVGSGARVILRGNSSIDGDNSALIVVDGVPNTMATNINPDDIESINVLRGASAAALYGSQAGNGAIIITTKKGTKGGFRVEVNSGLVLETPFALPDVQNKYGQGNNGIIDTNVGDSWGALMQGQAYTNHLGESAIYSPQTNNIRDFFATGVSLNNSISVSGGSEKVQTYLSYTNSRVEGIIPENDLLSHTTNLRISNTISDKLSVDAKVTYFTRKIDNMPRTGEGNTPVLDIYQIPRSLSSEVAKQYEAFDALGIVTPAAWPSTVSNVYGNPYWAIKYDVRDQKHDQIVGYLALKYKPVDWLSITGRANLDKSFQTVETRVNQGTFSWARQPGGYYSQSKSTNTQTWLDLLLEGENKIVDDLVINYQAGAIYQDREFSEISSVANGLNIANKFSINFATDAQSSSQGNRIRTNSLFGQFNLAYKNELFLEGSLRNDWDSRLSAPHSFQYYSLGGSAVLSDILSLPEEIDFLKLYISYAEVGNGGQFGLLKSSYSYRPGVGNGYLSRSITLPLPNLKPEIVRSREIGLESRFFNNRLGFNLTYYRSNSFNQLLLINLPSGTGYQNQYINAGNIQNSGVEFVLNGTPILTDNFKWDMDFNISFNKNKVVEISDDLDVVYQAGFIDFGGRPQIKTGGSYGDLVAWGWKRDDSGNLVVRADGTPLTTLVNGEQPKVIGNFNPDAMLGLTNTFKYKNFSLRALINGRIGGEIISGTEQNLSFSGITEATSYFRDGGWNLGGVDINGQPVNETITAQQFWRTASFKRFGVGEFFAYDATNIRMREVTLGYQFPLESKLIKSMKVSLVGRNLFWIYRGKALLDIPGVPDRKLWFDPDVSLFNGNGFQGIEYGAFPSTRSLGLNLNITF